MVDLTPSQKGATGYVRTSYSRDEVDAVAAYAIELRRCFLLPIADAAERRSIHLRVEPSRNNQARGVRWAEGYGFASMIERLREDHMPSGG